MTSSEFLLDSNIIVYSSNKDSPKYEKAKKLREKALKGGFKAAIAHQNIFESLRILTHKTFKGALTTSEALEHIESYTQFCKVIYPMRETKMIAFELIKRYKLAANKIFDAYLVATMLNNGVESILTDNVKDMKEFKEIKAINPFVNQIRSSDGKGVSELKNNLSATSKIENIIDSIDISRQRKK